MRFEIFQIKNIATTDYAFRDWECAITHGFDIADYKIVYRGEREKENILNNLWVEFNINHPEDFRGHSLSVSDIVVLWEPEEECLDWYYCDSIGWKNITEYIKENGYDY